MLVLHLHFLFGAPDPSVYVSYKAKNIRRPRSAYKAMSDDDYQSPRQDQVDAPPYTPELEVPVLINSLAHATLDPKTGSYSFSKPVEAVPADTANAQDVADALAGTGPAASVVVDQKLISTSHNPAFVSHNFTTSQIPFCNSQPAPTSSSAARWGGKKLCSSLWASLRRVPG